MYRTVTTTSSFIVILTLFFIIPASSISPAIAQTSLSSSGLASNGMDLGSMNFINNMSKGSSLFGTVGMSMVDGIKVTGVNLLQNNEVSVTLRHIVTTTRNATLPGSVTVMAIRVPTNLSDLMSIAAAAASNKTSNGNMNIMNAMQGYGATRNATSSMNNFNPLAFLKNIQIGSSDIVNANWRIPQSVAMGLVGSGSNNKPSPETADFIIVTVIPFTGKSSPAK
jgi:hypothetical protein